MNSKLLIVVISGFAAIGSLFLFNSNTQPKQQTARIIETVASPLSTKRFDLGSVKRSNLGGTPTPLPSLSQIPNPTFVPTTPTPTFTPSTTPAQTISPSPSSSNSSGSSASTPTTTPSQTPEQSAKININTADKTELDKITGVGPVIAQRIIDYRQTNGPFQKIEDLKNVKGIGDVNFEKMKNEITI